MAIDWKIDGHRAIDNCREGQRKSLVLRYIYKQTEKQTIVNTTEEVHRKANI